MAAEQTAALAEDTSPGTAVVFVHGMRERHHLEILDGFARTALRSHADTGKPTFHPRPAVVTDSYEARCCATQGFEIYEYDWSFLVTADRSAGFGATALRLFLRRPSNVPDPLFGMWRTVWIALLAVLLSVPALFVAGYLLSTDVPGSIVGVVSGLVVLLFWLGLFRFVMGAVVNSAVAAPLVSVARYLDTSPSSYASRRAVRTGLVDLLRDLHDGRYSRIIMVAHGVGTFIAYDALTLLWAQTPAPDLASSEGGDADAGLGDFQDRQFTLWQDLQRQGSPWRVSDFITVGAPLAMADLLLTRPEISSGFKDSDVAHRRELLDDLTRRGVLVRCPPRSQSLGFLSPFAVTRWTNLWFPVIRGSMQGDWFGGALGTLFGPGIRDIPVYGNEPERLKRGSAHAEYFSSPDRGDDGDMAWHLRSTLAR